MILFLDVISPIPKFVIINNNKPIESLEILDKNNQKVSNNIHKKFLILEKKYNLCKLLKFLIVTTGPGSFTSLRVGISFMLGISFSRKIPISGIDGMQLFSNFVKIEDFYVTLLLICSSNDQNFLCLPLNHKSYNYEIIKILDMQSLSKINLLDYSTCLSNYKLPELIKKLISSKIKKIKCIDFEKKINDNFLKLYNNKSILQPIYISDNKLFD